MTVYKNSSDGAVF